MMFDELTIAIVGARHPNKGPGNRETEIMMCAPGDPITLEAEPSNPADKNAIAAFSQHGIQIGYVLADRTLLFRQAGEAGKTPWAIFQQPTPGGCLIRVSFDGNKPSLPPAPPPTMRPAGDMPADRISDDWDAVDYIPPDE